MINRLIEKIFRTPFIHILWVSVALSVASSEAITAAMSLYFHGVVTADYLVTGAVASFFVSGGVTLLIIAFVNHVRAIDSRYQEERFAAAAVNVRLAAALEQTGEGVYITDAGNKIVYANPAFTRITGYSAAEVLGKTPDCLKSGKHPEQFYRTMWETLRAGKAWEGRFINRRKDGGLFDQLTGISPVFGQDGTAANYVAVMRDVSREEMLNRARRYFTAVTSHELRTPLSRMQLVESLITMALAAPADQVELLRQAADGLEKCRKDFDDILATTDLLAQLSGGESRGEDRSCHLHFLLQQCAAHTGKRIGEEQRSLTFTVDLARLPAFSIVPAKREMLGWAVNELLANAVRFTPDGGTVPLEASVDGDEAVIAVTDTGIGIPEGSGRDVFEPYFALEDIALHSSGKYRFKSGGMGLGLTLVKMVMEHHNADFSVTSEGENRGTRAVFRLKLPADGTGF
ncbi:MAG: PAS domain S-box protein [Nitrospinae bacterium]|nr:PAS domain S-box protein [Nitrospinota bacterium]